MVDQVTNPTSPSPVAGSQPSASPMKKMPKSPVNVGIIIGAILVILVGVGSGWFLSGKSTASQGSADKMDTGAKQNDTEAGVEDASTFPDTAEGILRKGGIEGEGTHYLERGSGPKQYAYLTSTVIDLESFVDKKVQVWGETITSVHAPWLMDVGKIKVIE